MQYFGIEIDLTRDQIISEFAMKLLKDYYMRKDESSPQEAYARAAIAYCGGDLELAQRLYDYVSKGWFMYSSPVLSNAPKSGELAKGLPISCFLIHIADSLESIIDSSSELRWMSVKGGGVGGHWSDVRAVSDKAPGVIPFLKTVDADMQAYKQGSVRRGSYAAYLDISHPDIIEFLNMRTPTGGDSNRKCLNLHNAVNVTDEFMQALIDNAEWKLIDPHDKTVREVIHARELWERILETRFRTGEPYIHYIDTSNKYLPNTISPKAKINGSNLCVAGDQRFPSQFGLLTAKELYDIGEPLTLFDNDEVVQATKMHLIKKNTETLKITLANGLTHTITPEHRINVKLSGNKKTEGIEAQNLKIGDRVLIQTNKGIFGSKSMEDEAFLLGQYQADGTQFKNLIMLDVWEKDFDLIPEIEERFSRIHFKYECDKYDIKNSKTNLIVTRGRTPAKFTECTVNQSLVRKQRLASRTLSKALDFKKGLIPQWIWESDEATQWQYIRGLYYADGTASIINNLSNSLYIGITSINKEFLKQLQLLLMNLGMKPSLKKQVDSGTRLLPNGKGGHSLYETKEAYRLIISNKDNGLVFNEKTKFLDRKNIKFENIKKSNCVVNTSKVLRIEKAENQDVYCCTVNNAKHLFVSNGFVSFNCNEIFLATSETRSAVCCLSSLNLEFYDDWKDTQIVRDLIRMLDNVLQAFIDGAPKELQKAIYSAQQERSLGLGAMGFHSFLHKKQVPWESAIAKILNEQIFSYIKEEAVKETMQLAIERGEYEDAKTSLSIELDDGSTLEINSSDLVETQRGIIRAFDLKEDDEVLHILD